MINHLTEDQISKWFIGQSSASEQRHAQICHFCTAELEGFLNTLGSFKTALTSAAETRSRRTSPNLGMVLSHRAVASKGATLFQPIEKADDFRHTRWLSLAVHAVVLGLLILPAAITGPLPSRETLVMLYNKTLPVILHLPGENNSQGGGGGGRKTLTPPSKGVLPRGADKQIVPPLVEARNLAPEVVVESTIIAPQLANVRPLDFQFGDPNGVVGPPSAGPGTGGGIGTGIGTGVGPGKGPGAGPGEGGGIGGGVYQVGGGVTEPVLLAQIQPEYSDDGRKARIQGTVELLIVVNADGTVKFDTVRKSLGYGLDQKAMEAVKKWKFAPGKKDGKPVATYVSVVVNFSLR
jgi:TonB family protein